MKFVYFALCLMIGGLTAAFANGGGTCATATVIPGCPFTDAGTFDLDDDCNSPVAMPYNEVFYSFTPSATGNYQFLVRGYGRQAAMRIMQGGCCADGVSNGSASTPVSIDCGEPASSTTYFSADLTAGVLYFFHIGTSTSMVSNAAFDFQMTCVPCPRNESAVNHATCQTAEVIAENDSLLADSSNGSTPDWFRFALTTSRSVRIFCGGREFGHCISGVYPLNPPDSPVDGRFSVFVGTNCNNLVRLGDYDEEGCSADAIGDLGCLAAGTYWIRVNCNGSQPYILKVASGDPPACPAVSVPAQHCAGPCVGPLPDQATVSYPIEVGIPYHITDLNVRLTLTHSHDSNLDLWLVTPWADTIMLANSRGGAGDNYTGTLFDDGAATPIGSGLAPFAGSYRPEELLSAVVEHAANGTWLFVARDDATLEQGYLNCVCLEFSYDRILDVELTGFDAERADGQVTLRWSTAAETESEAFEIERDGSLVSRTPGAGTSTSTRNYQWTDSDVFNGTTYHYTLIAVSLGGTRRVLGALSTAPSFSNAPVSDYALHQNYPNPFNPETSIAFDLPVDGLVRLAVYNLLGQEVAPLVNRTLQAGRHVVSFDGSNLPTGIYVCRMEAAGFSDQKKMILMK
ncbi:T9SS type A sorting domain-containing protein [candidate division KSB1 bacterium]|nr:T9SS type A sorting domain-containing protein [candidate division KSB1 bacterium]